MKAIYMLAFFFIFIQKVNAQIIVSGTAKDTSGNAITFATIIVKNIEADNILDYTLTNEEGKYSIEIHSKADSLKLVFSYLDYAEIVKNIKNCSQIVNFLPKIHMSTLPEVILKTLPIQQRNDTIDYNVTSFLNKNDRTLSDVLKKMPGIEVDNTGRIKYQGKYINKFYVEGKDLMEGNYGLISTTLPAHDAITVQVLQHHQPINMFKGKVYSPNAAINIKLKKNVTLTGRGKLGAGFSPFLHEADITPMIFSKKYQALVSLKTNNVGQSLNEDNYSEFTIDQYEGVTQTSKREQWLSIAQTDLPNENQQRFLFNSDYLTSLNLLTDITKKLDIRTNVDLIKTNESIIGSTESITNLVTGDTIRVKEHSVSKQEDQYLNVRVTLQNNAANNFFRNTTFYKTEYEHDDGIMLQQNNLFKQSLKDFFKNLQNSFSTIFPIDKAKKYNLSLKSMFSYKTGTPVYFVTPVTNLFLDSISTNQDSSLLQKLTYEEFITNNSASFSFTRNRLTIISKLGYRFSQNKLKSELFENGVTKAVEGNWHNNVVLLSDVKQMSINCNYNGKKFVISSTLPVNMYNIRLSNQNYPTQKHNRLAFEPFLNILYRRNLYWEANITASRQVNFSSIKDLATGNILTALNQFSNQSGSTQTALNNISPSINYKNPFSNVFVNIFYTYNLSANGAISNSTYLPNGQILYNRIEKKSHSNIQATGFSIGKYFSNLNTNISFNGSLNAVESEFLLNNKFTKSNIYGYNSSIKIVSGALKKVYFDLSGNYSFNYRHGFDLISRFSQFILSSTFLFEPLTNHSLKLNNDCFFGRSNYSNSTYNILDVFYQLSIPKRIIDIDLGCTNIFNQKNYKQTFLADATTSTFLYYFRPLQITASVSFNIK